MRRSTAIVVVSAVFVCLPLLHVAGAPEGTMRSIDPTALSVGSARIPPEPRPFATSSCLRAQGVRCYSPGQFEQAYHLGELHASGIDGRGTTIAIVDSFGSPTIRNDLHAFDQAFGHSPAPNVPADPAILYDPKLTIIQPAGKVPAFKITNSEMDGWAVETTLDVEWAHVFAPRADILLVETPVDETEGVQGFPQIVAAENYVIDHGLADVISQSFGATEASFPSAAAILDLRSAFQNAHRHHVTVLAASGDEGATSDLPDSNCCYGHRANSWPSSDPLVTSVGGTALTLDDAGDRIRPDVVWNDIGAGGGGTSSVFSRPPFQTRVRRVTGAARGTPDISMSAAVDGGVWIYVSAFGGGVPFQLVGGTSEGTPEFSGVVAMAAQLRGHRLGWINSTLYRMSYAHDGIVDVTTGNNTFAGVSGFTATSDYDLASGVGTVDTPSFVRSLARKADDADGEHGAR